LHAPRTEADTAVVYCDVQRPDGAPSEVRLFVQASTANVRADLARIDQNVAIVALGALALAVVLSALTARRLARPLGRLADEAARVAAGDAKPIAPSGPTEVRALAHAFSQMLDDLARTRRRLDAASRIAAWSEVAKRVAHEVKNPLSPIRASIETLRRLRGRDDGAFADYFDEATATVLSEVRRLTVLVDEFTRFARLPAPRPERFDVTQCVREICTLHRSAVPVDVESPPSPVMLLADRHQVVQVVTNLLANAIDACGSLPGGRVRVTVTADAASVTVSVEDNGPGVPTSFEPRLFEPYATGKEQGTGLGLALSQRIAVEHGGDLSYERNALGGAHFRLTLPQRTGHGNGGDASARQVGEESLRTSVDPMDPPAS
jgi:nitrogen fixation/metabolism regulation signal transduction histidine kinase